MAVEANAATATGGREEERATEPPNGGSGEVGC